MDAARQGRLSQIDALRGLAALVVLAFHYITRYDQVFVHTTPLAISASAGQKGVFLFFAISGFVIFLTLDRTRAPMDFIVSRFSRLYPVYWASALLTWALLAAVDLPGYAVTPLQGLVNLTMLHGFFRVRDLDGVYWSLQVELLFYAWALVLWLAGAVRRPTVVCIAWASLALAANAWDSAGAPPFPGTLRIFLLLDFIPFFVLGIMAYVTLRDRHVGMTHIAAILVSLAAIAATGETLMLAVAVASVLLVFAGARGHLRLLDCRPLVLLGAISYPLYLTHQMLGMTVILWLERAGVSPWLAIGAATACSLAVATALHYAVEMPAMDAIRTRYRRHREASGTPSYRRVPWLAASMASIAALGVVFVVTGKLQRAAESHSAAASAPSILQEAQR